MNKLSDLELIENIKSGDALSLEALIKRYMNLVKIMVRKSFIVGGEEEDLYQEGLLAIVNATSQYDPTKNTTFASFVATCIKRKIIDAIRTATRDKHKPLNDAFPLCETQDIELDSTTTFNPLDIYLEKEWAEDFHKKLNSILSPLQLNILSLYFDGYSYAEIARISNITTKKVDNTLFAIKTKIRKELEYSSP